MLTDAELAAIEERLAPVPAGIGRVVADRANVLALLAEFRALCAFVPAALAALEEVSWVLDSLDGLRAEQGGDERLVRKLRGHLTRTRGAVLAALESRPAGVEADHEAGRRVLGRVMADRAELERLREPPDAAGLITREMLNSLREYWAGVGPDDTREVSPSYMETLLSHIDAQAALVREQYGLISDLLAHGDGPGVPAYERGRAEGHAGAVLAVARISPVSIQHQQAAGAAFALDVALEKIKALGPFRPPLPPCAEAAAAQRLREALRQCLDALEVFFAAGKAYSPSGFHERAGQAAAAARKALGEDGGA